jgi:hypothetical protein
MAETVFIIQMLPVEEAHRSPILIRPAVLLEVLIHTLQVITQDPVRPHHLPTPEVVVLEVLALVVAQQEVPVVLHVAQEALQGAAEAVGAKQY